MKLTDKEKKYINDVKEAVKDNYKVVTLCKRIVSNFAIISLCIIDKQFDEPYALIQISSREENIRIHGEINFLGEGTTFGQYLFIKRLEDILGI